MKMPPLSTDGIVATPVWRKPRLPKSRLLAGIAMTLALLAGGQANAAQLTIGNISTFASGSNLAIPVAGTWRLGDKDWTYLSQTGGWDGQEQIKLTTNVNPLLLTHEFLIDTLSTLSMTGNVPLEAQLGYRVSINELGPASTFYDARMGQIVSGATVEVWQDIYGSLASFNANLLPGSGTLMTHYSLDGSNPPAGLFPGGLTDLWVRNSIKLSLPGGSISSINDTFRQAVPEIDPTSFGSALSLLFGAVGILERRTRRRLAAAVAA
jgi:hypothetical protein